MGYDFFNTSSTAFGSRLTAAFLSLTKLGEDAEIRLNEILQDWDLYKAYIGNSYRVPKPTSLDDPVRTNEIFDIFANKPIIIDTLEYSNNRLNVKIYKFNTTNNRMTVISGYTSKKEGYIYYDEATSNTRPNKPIRVESSSLASGELLFQYRIDSNNKVNLIGGVKSTLALIPVDASHLTKVNLGSRVSSENKRYESNDYECLLVVGRDSIDCSNENPAIRIYKNGRQIMRGNGYDCRRYCIIYTKPDDVITGRYSGIYRITYV